MHFCCKAHMRGEIWSWFLIIYAHAQMICSESGNGIADEVLHWELCAILQASNPSHCLVFLGNHRWYFSCLHVTWIFDSNIADIFCDAIQGKGHQVILFLTRVQWCKHLAAKYHIYIFKKPLPLLPLVVEVLIHFLFLNMCLYQIVSWIYIENQIVESVSKILAKKLTFPTIRRIGAVQSRLT
jgi:hypothetical protein